MFEMCRMYCIWQKCNWNTFLAFPMFTGHHVQKVRHSTQAHPVATRCRAARATSSGSTEDRRGIEGMRLSWAMPPSPIWTISTKVNPTTPTLPRTPDARSWSGPACGLSLSRWEAAPRLGGPLPSDRCSKHCPADPGEAARSGQGKLESVGEWQRLKPPGLPAPPSTQAFPGLVAAHRVGEMHPTRGCRALGWKHRRG